VFRDATAQRLDQPAIEMNREKMEKFAPKTSPDEASQKEE
jgi:hypothetical protein